MTNCESQKQISEIEFWKNEVARYEQWYRGELACLSNTPSPKDDAKIKYIDLRHSSILTWHRLHQEAKYLFDLMLESEAFIGMKILDMGSGPIPSATCFKGADIYCLDPLLPQYLEIGFPIHCYNKVTFIHAAAERIPVEDGFFDCIISVNAIDHFDNLQDAAKEIKRVLKPDGLLRMHVHYHNPTSCEPLSLNDEMLLDAFEWCKGFKRIKSARVNFSTTLSIGEMFTLWSNF